MSPRRRRNDPLPVLPLAAAGLVVFVAGVVLSHPFILLAVGLLAAAGIAAAVAAAGHNREIRAEQHRRALYEASCLASADPMSGPQFEDYIAGLMALDGATDVQVIGGRGDGGADILATERSGRPVAIQCKRQMAPVPVGVVRQLIGSVTHEHRGRAGVLITTAHLTRPAADLARQSGITVVDRDALGRWMAQARTQLAPQPPDMPLAPAPRPGRT